MLTRTNRLICLSSALLLCFSSARGRTNLELREKFILPEGASQGLAAFRSRGRRSKPGSRNASPTRSSSSASHSGTSLPSAPSTPATPTASASSRVRADISILRLISTNIELRPDLIVLTKKESDFLNSVILGLFYHHAMMNLYFMSAHYATNDRTGIVVLY